MIKSVLNVAAPRAQVFQALTDFARYATWVPGCEKCQIVNAKGDVTDIDLVINSIRRLELGLRFEAEPVQSIRFRMTRGKDIKGYSGTYRLMDSADRKGTVVISELEIDGGFLAPKFIVDRVAGKALHDTGEALKKYLGTVEYKAEPAAAATQPEARRKRNKHIVRVVGTPTGYQVRFFGENYFIARKQ
jgi:carbon monoxide dehydrogenase subunit G